MSEQDRDPDELDADADNEPDEEEEVAGATEEAAPTAPEVAAAPKKRYQCNYCSESFDNSLAKARHIHTVHRDKIKGKAIEEKEKEELQTEASIIASIRLEGPEALAKVIRQRLQEELDSPGVDSRSLTTALRNWDNDPSIHFDFQSLGKMLVYDAGIKTEKAMRIVEKLYMLYKKFEPMLGNIAIAPFFGAPQPQGYPMQFPPYPQGNYPVQFPQQPPFQPPSQYTIYPWGPQGGGPPPYGQMGYQQQQQERLTRKDIKEMVEEVVNAALVRVPEQPKPAEPMAEVQMPIGINEDGSTQTQTLRVPMSAVPYLLLIAQGKTASKGSGTTADPTQIIDQLSEKLVTPLQQEIKELNKEVTAARVEANEAREKAAQDKLDELSRQLRENQTYIRDLEKELRDQAKEYARSQVTEGYQSDTFKLIGQGIQELNSLIKDRKPLELAAKTVFTPPPEVPKTSSHPVLDELEKEGYVKEK